MSSRPFENLIHDTKFDDLCAALQRNDPDVVDVTIDIYYSPSEYDLPVPLGYGRLLGEALRNNTHVRCLHLDMDFFLVTHYMATYNHEKIKSEIKVLLDFIANSVSLSKVTLWCADGGPNMSRHKQILANVLLDAVVCNPNITELISNLKYYSSVDFVRCLTTPTHKLQTLNIRFYFNTSTPEIMERLASALGTISTLENLTLFQTRDTPSTKILLQLCQPSVMKSQNLEVLGIAYDNNPNCLTALFNYLETTSALQDLALLYFPFVGVRFAETLSNCKSITCLSLDECTFDSAATERFVAVMQHNNNMQQLRQLRIVWCTFSRSSSSRQAAQPPDDRQPLVEALVLVGSRLEEYTVDFRGPSGQYFFRDLCANASLIRVKRLLFHCDRIDFTSFSQFMLISTTFQELMIEGGWGRNVPLVCPAQVVAVLSKNGSLHKLVEPDEDHISAFTKSFFKEPLLHHIQAVGKRNECLPKLLSSPSTNGSCTTTTTDISLFPTLFAVAKQAPRMAPNNLLIGLLATADFV